MIKRNHFLAIAAGLIAGLGLAASAYREFAPNNRLDWIEPVMIGIVPIVTLLCAISMNWWELRAHGIFTIITLMGLIAGVVVIDKTIGCRCDGSLADLIFPCLIYGFGLTLTWGLGRLVRRFRISRKYAGNDQGFEGDRPVAPTTKDRRADPPHFS